MRALCLIAISATVLGISSAQAEEIQVKKFASMTRITIPMSYGNGWSVQRISQGLNLKTQSTNPGVTAPPLSSDSRLRQLDVWQSASESGIDIRFGCDCTASHYAEADAIIIDVRERGATVAPASTVTREASAWGQTTVNLQTTPGNFVTRETAESEELWRLANILLATPLPRPRPAKPVVTAQTTVSDDPAIDALRDSVLKQLSLAAEQGRISMDSGAPREKTTYVAAGCADESVLELKRLAGTGGYRDALPELRTAVYDDLKQIDPAAVRRLARHFIAFGLGEEARNVIAAFNIKGAPESLILSMAKILEGDLDNIDDHLLVKPGCGPRATVWRATVAAIRGDGNVRDMQEAIGGAILDLPGPLRKMLGARIALGLIEEGDRDGAMRLWRNLETADGPDTPEMRLLAAHTEKGRQLSALLHLSESRFPGAGEASISAADMLLERDDPARAERLNATLDDLIFLNQGQPAEAKLALARARLQGRYGDLESALTTLSEKAQKHPDKANHWRDVARETIHAATIGADPVARPHDFSTILASLRYLDKTEKSDTARFSIVRQLINAGGSSMVADILTPPVLKRSAEARRLLAEAKLLNGDPSGARALLARMDDEESTALTEKAEAMSGTTARNAAEALFAPVQPADPEASIANARKLMDDAKTDLSIVEELLIDG